MDAHPNNNSYTSIKEPLQPPAVRLHEGSKTATATATVPPTPATKLYPYHNSDALIFIARPKTLSLTINYNSNLVVTYLYVLNRRK